MLRPWENVFIHLQACLRFTSIVGGAPKTGILHKLVKNFIGFSSLINELSVKKERKVQYACTSYLFY